MNFISEVKLRTNDPMEAAPVVKEALRKNKVLKIIPEYYLGDLRAFYDTLSDQLGMGVDIGEDFTKSGADFQTGEKWIEIRYDKDIPDLAAYRHSKNAQPLHTDESYVTDPADIMFFYCINKAIKGGATTFVDGPELVEYMENNAPELLAKLLNTKVRYSKANLERTEKIIDLQDDGQYHFNFNFWCIAKNETEENKKLNADFYNFLQDYVAHSHMAERVELKPGEAVVWWDELVLHGRTSYHVEKTNDRFIWKTGFKWVG
jgi:alpha-ketoglutarate-dependent taurine dioxygenase